jgi:hypothetical protein
MRALGRFQLNRGDYSTALETLSKAEGLAEDLSDWEGMASVKSEVAAYFLNRNELQRALALYQEAEALRRRFDLGGPSDHTLLMLGVVQRRLRHYPEAIKALTDLQRRGREQKNLSAEATASHHLAWVYFEQKEVDRARNLGMCAKALYEEIRDPRGSADADEQLGWIALTEKDFVSAQRYLERSLSVRQQLGNQQGIASSLCRLAKLSLSQGDCGLGLKRLGHSLALYWRLGALSYQRILSIARKW